MDIKIEHHNNGSRIALAGEITIYSATQLKEQLLDAIDRCNALDIDLANVSEFDSAGLQLLALIKREAGTRGKPIRFGNHNELVLEVLDLYDLFEMFDADPAIASSSSPQDVFVL